MSDIEFFDAPPPGRAGRGRGDWDELLSPLVDHPGKWAIVKHYDKPNGASSAAQSLRDGRIGRRLGRWDATSRAAGDGSDVWACYLGPHANNGDAS